MQGLVHFSVKCSQMWKHFSKCTILGTVYEYQNLTLLHYLDDRTGCFDHLWTIMFLIQNFLQFLALTGETHLVWMNEVCLCQSCLVTWFWMMWLIFSKQSNFFFLSSMWNGYIFVCSETWHVTCFFFCLQSSFKCCSDRMNVLNEIWVTVTILEDTGDFKFWSGWG